MSGPPPWLPVALAAVALAAIALRRALLARGSGIEVWVAATREPAERRILALAALPFAGFAAVSAAAVLAPSSLAALGPVRALGHPLLGWAGLGLMAAGIALMVWAQGHMGRSWRIGIPAEATDLVTDGPFRRSRNPIYLGGLAAGFGFALALPTVVSIASAILAAALARATVLTEERHLAARHGAAWTAYAARTRRWL